MNAPKKPGYPMVLFQRTQAWGKKLYARATYLPNWLCARAKGREHILAHSRTYRLGFAYACLLLGLAVAPKSFAAKTTFVLAFSNIATGDTLKGVKALPLAPGVWVVHENANPLFQAGKRARPNGLEAMAEDGHPERLLHHAAKTKGVVQAGILFAELLLPGATHSFTFSVETGQRLSFATMFVQSNDKFYAPKGQGIALFSAQGKPLSGDITAPGVPLGCRHRSG